VTEITNGIALCRQCHYEIHKIMGTITPKDWQKRAFDNFIEHEELSFLLETTMGGGKTIFSAFCSRYVLQQQIADFVLVVVPSIIIKGDKDAGFLGDYHKVGLNLKPMLKDNTDCPSEYQAAAITYQQLPNIISTIETWVRNGKRLFVVLDEIHHACTENVWGTFVERLGNSAVKILAMTGTAFRGDQQRISFVNYDVNNKAIPDFRYTYREAVRDEICRPVQFLTDDGLAQFVRSGENPSEVRISEAEDERDRAAVSRTIFRDGEWLRMATERADGVLGEYRQWDRDAACLVVCRPATDERAERYIHQIAKLIAKTTGEKPLIVTHDDSDSAAKIQRFRRGSERYICAIRQVSEGVDIKRIRVVLFANCPTTELLFRQIVGRAVRVDSDEPGDATIIIPKFPQLIEWARTIAEEAKAGKKERKPKPSRVDVLPRSNDLFTALGSTHEEGGAISDFGDQYTVGEINAAERQKAEDPRLFTVPVTTLAHILRKFGVAADPTGTADEPLHIQKEDLRAKINKAVRQLAVRINKDAPDFASVWIAVHAQTGARNIDDLTDNFNLEVMRQALDFLKYELAKINVTTRYNHPSATGDGA
jgi:superfamily II DNA or RNA helicase